MLEFLRACPLLLDRARRLGAKPVPGEHTSHAHGTSWVLHTRLMVAEALKQTCWRLSPLHLAESVEVVVDNLDEEARVYANLAEQHAAQARLIGVKDAMIWSLLQDR